MITSALLYSFLFLVALIYASIGLGGATGYLAVFALFGRTNPVLAPTVLLLNIFVAGLSFQAYYRNGYFNARLLLVFVFTSIPASFAGGMIPVNENVFSMILGVVLLVAGVQLFFSGPQNHGKKENPSLWTTLPAGIILGIIAGLTGSGGGFLLIPLLIVYFGTDPREAAAVAAAFVVINSMAGFGGHFVRGHYSLAETIPLLVVVGLGGFFGSRIGANLFKPKTVQRIMSVILLLAGLKILIPTTL